MVKKNIGSLPYACPDCRKSGLSCVFSASAINVAVRISRVQNAC